jgi:hypothetical protein
MDAEGTLVVPMGRRVGWEGGKLGSGAEFRSTAVADLQPGAIEGWQAGLRS